MFLPDSESISNYAVVSFSSVVVVRDYYFAWRTPPPHFGFSPGLRSSSGTRHLSLIGPFVEGSIGLEFETVGL